MTPIAKLGLVMAMVALLAAGQLVDREFADDRREARERRKGPRPYEALLVPLPDARLPERPSAAEDAAPARAAASDGERAARTYVVKPGDTLGKIARKIYGSEGAWKAIYDANRAAIPDPARLQVGATLRIPPRERGTQR